ncbi:hypothetical protein BDV33DRAFT_184983 [Aspergillus novoparasiticus]|uniref:CCHC-type domain-containing protein n=1 Tax=Aspergillus novoparasiticus TaxID=986946 RepID=A0A5N6E8C2_9EURO|nr:hypothetical protein BDV33DRAFT_184983 [Aspergillus novoparasiticus]
MDLNAIHGANGRDFSKHRGRGGLRGRGRGRGNGRKCYNCNKPGHLAKDCYSKPKEDTSGEGRGR